MLKTENGRSMVEMLGVLAIIGVLSVGGITGYRYAMEKYKINNFVNQLSLLLIDLESQVKMGNEDLKLNSLVGMGETKIYAKDTIAIGEVGLTGEVRSVNQMEKRLKEAEKLGFKKCIIPQSNKKLLKDEYKLDIIGVQNIVEAMRNLGLKN